VKYEVYYGGRKKVSHLFSYFERKSVDNSKNLWITYFDTAKYEVWYGGRNIFAAKSDGFFVENQLILS